MKVIDTHCDVLYKMQVAKRSKNERLDFLTAQELDANLSRLQSGGVYIQFFALFIDEAVQTEEKWTMVVEQIELFKHNIIERYEQVKHITKWSDIDHLTECELGAVLTLEGM